MDDLGGKTHYFRKHPCGGWATLLQPHSQTHEFIIPRFRGTNLFETTTSSNFRDENQTNIWVATTHFDRFFDDSMFSKKKWPWNHQIPPIFLNREKKTWHPATIPKLRPKTTRWENPTVPWSRPRKKHLFDPRHSAKSEGLRRVSKTSDDVGNGWRRWNGVFLLVLLGFFQVRNSIWSLYMFIWGVLVIFFFLEVFVLCACMCWCIY